MSEFYLFIQRQELACFVKCSLSQTRFLRNTRRLFALAYKWLKKEQMGRIRPKISKATEI